MQRRHFLKLGVGASALLVLGGGLAALTRPGWEAGHLTEAGREVMGSVARAVLDGLLPAKVDGGEAAISTHLRNIEATINALPPITQKELALLLAIVAHPVGRRSLVGLSAEWGDASVAQVQAALREMSESSLATRQQMFHALRELTTGTFFSTTAGWAATGYPGPLEI